MNKDTVKGTIDDAAGRAKRQVGEWTGDTQTQAEGATQQVKGKIENAIEQALLARSSVYGFAALAAHFDFGAERRHWSNQRQHHRSFGCRDCRRHRESEK